MATIDKTRYLSNFKRTQATLASAEAVLKSAEADMKLKETIYERNKTLRKNSQGRLPAQNDWDRDYAAFLSANAIYMSSKAKVQEAKFAFESTGYDLNKTVIWL